MITKGKIKYLPKEERSKVKQVIKWCKKIFKGIEEIEFLNGKINFSVCGIKFELLVEKKSVLIGGIYTVVSPLNTKIIMIEKKDYPFNKEGVERGLKYVVDLIEKISE